MRGVVEHYYQLLDISTQTFEQKLFTASYHALSAAMHCAMALKDQHKREEVHRQAIKHFDSICEQIGPHSMLDERLEISLYRSLVKLSDPTRKFHSGG